MVWVKKVKRSQVAVAHSDTSAEQCQNLPVITELPQMLFSFPNPCATNTVNCKQMNQAENVVYVFMFVFFFFFFSAAG